MRETEPIEASASPRNPSVEMWNRSSALDSLDVACRETASGQFIRSDAAAIVRHFDQQAPRLLDRRSRRFWRRHPGRSPPIP